MPKKPSPRLLNIVEELPLKNGIRILEIGCGTGTMAREIANRFDKIFIFAIDRSEKAISQCVKNSQKEIANGKIHFHKADIENFSLPNKTDLFDLAIAVRVGAVDGRHPEIEKQALQNIKKALKINGKFYIDSENTVKQINL